MQKIHQVIVFFCLIGFFSFAGVLAFISFSEAAQQKKDFAKNWSECDCHYSKGVLGCANSGDHLPRGLWLGLGNNKPFAIAIYDKWAFLGLPNMLGMDKIPMAYRIGYDEPVIHTMRWKASEKLALSSDLDLHFRLLVAITEEKRIAIKLADGPIHIIDKCHDGPKEAVKYLKAIRNIIKR